LGNENDHGRSDISIFNPPFGAYEKHLLDIKIAAVLEGSRSGKIKVPRNIDADKKSFFINLKSLQETIPGADILQPEKHSLRYESSQQ
jgi:predicted RNA methylase